MKLRTILIFALALVLLTGCAKNATAQIDNQPAGDVQTDGTETAQENENGGEIAEDGTEASENVAENTEGGETVEGQPAETGDPAVIDSEIKHEPNPEDQGVDRGVWEHIIDYSQSGDIIYDFGDFFVTVPQSWQGKYRTEITENGDSMTMTFYQTLSEDLFMDKYGFGGGKLFWISYSADEEYKQLPSYEVIGESEDSMTYYLGFPTDVQAYTEDEAAAAEYQEMSSQYDYIIEHSHMRDELVGSLVGSDEPEGSVG